MPNYTGLCKWGRVFSPMSGPTILLANGSNDLGFYLVAREDVSAI